MSNLARFPYTLINDPLGAALQRPVLAIQLTSGKSINADALLDTGADANPLPYQMGLTLGLSWAKARPVPAVSGNLGQVEARAVALKIAIQPFASVMMVFIWVKTDAARLLLGQINFFQEFDVCFFGAARYFEINLKGQLAAPGQA